MGVLRKSHTGLLLVMSVCANMFRGFGLFALLYSPVCYVRWGFYVYCVCDAYKNEVRWKYSLEMRAFEISGVSLSFFGDSDKLKCLQVLMENF